MFAHKPRYKCTTTKTMYDAGDHSSLPTSNIIALGLLEKKEERKMMNNFVWAVKMLFRKSGTSQPYFCSCKGLYTNADTTVKNIYTVKPA